MSSSTDQPGGNRLRPEDFLRRLPKVELHCHFIGAIPAELILELADKNGVDVPTTEPERLYDFSGYESAQERERYFFVLLDVASRALVDHDDFGRAAYEVVRRHAAPHSVRYMELFVNPTGFPGIDYATIVDGIAEGLEAAHEEFQVRTNIVVAILREQGPSVALDLVGTVLGTPRPFVRGIAMDGPEEIDDHRPHHFAAAYELARTGGLHRTAHATLASPADVTVCVEMLACDRIDHGYRILEDPALAQRFRDEERTITVCPTITTEVFGASDPRWCDPSTHPARVMIEAGLPISIGTDDPCVVPANLTAEYEKLLGGQLFDADVAARVALQGAKAAWLDDTERRRLIANFEREIATLRRALDGESKA